MNDLTPHETEQQAPPHKPGRRRAAPRRAAEDFEAPDEFAGMTAHDCCDACLAGKIDAEVAQKRLQEIDQTYPRQVSLVPNNPTVMELDAEWLARNSQVADEFRRLSKALQGGCIISGGACAHPFKSPLQSSMFGNREVFERYQRAKRVLADQRKQS